MKQALEMVRSKRSIVCPNEGFMRELKRLELMLHRKQQYGGKERESVTNGGKRELRDIRESVSSAKNGYHVTNNGRFEDEEEKKVVLDFINNEDKKRGLRLQN